MLHRLLMARRVVIAAGLLMTVLLLGAGPAEAGDFAFEPGSNTLYDIGNDMSQGTNFDILRLTGIPGDTGTMNLGDSVTMAISTVDFIAGWNCVGSGPSCPNSGGNIPYTVTVGAQTLTLSPPYYDYISSSDTLNLGSDTVWFTVPGGYLEVTSLPYGPDVNGGGKDEGTLYGTFTYSATTPEPLSMVLMGTFLTLAGLALGKRKLFS
jgi:hypothetical protein